jgi:prevent-host-death family protein
VTSCGLMNEVGIRELKGRLSLLLRSVEKGETVIVTDRGRPIAEIRPVPSASAPIEDDASLLQNVRDGRLLLPQVRNTSEVYGLARKPLLAYGSSEELLAWTRGDR